VECFFFPGALLCRLGPDLVFGDPGRKPRPVCWMGRSIAAGERMLLGSRAEDVGAPGKGKRSVP